MLARLSSEARSQKIGLSLHVKPYFMCAIGKAKNAQISYFVHFCSLTLLKVYDIRPLVNSAKQKINFLISQPYIYCGYSKEPSL